MKQKPTRQQALDAVRTIIHYIGDDPDREGLTKTPERVIKAWEHDWGQGYDADWKREQIDSIKGAEFTDGSATYDQMIAVTKIRFVSHCEHHMAEFAGTVDIAYIPKANVPGQHDGPILGLSKLVRIVNMFSRKLQVQERLTSDIATFINEYCRPLGVGVVIRATHSCMCSRGVRQYETVAVTSALRGQMLSQPEVRDEFFRLVGK